MKPETIRVHAQMLVRRPPAEVFRAFTDPGITTKFWFNRSTGPLTKGAAVRWFWDKYGASAPVKVLRLVPDELIVIEWGEIPSVVEFKFTPAAGGHTYMEIFNYGFQVKGEELIHTLKDSTGGFTTVLDGLKAYLEHGLELNLIRDKFL